LRPAADRVGTRRGSDLRLRGGSGGVAEGQHNYVGRPMLRRNKASKKILSPPGRPYPLEDYPSGAVRPPLVVGRTAGGASLAVCIPYRSRPIARLCSAGQKTRSRCATGRGSSAELARAGLAGRARQWQPLPRNAVSRAPTTVPVKAPLQRGATSVDDRQLHRGGGPIIGGAASGLIRGGIPGDRGRGSPGPAPPNRETRASSLADFAMWRVVILNHNRRPHNTDAPRVVADIHGHVCTPALKGFRQKARHSADRKGACV
jgi:hypothetical protein